MNNLVYHYCSLDTFFSIITNKTLRLSDVAKSNDNLEVMWLKKIMTKMMEKENMSYEFFNDKIKKAYSLEKYKEKLMEKTDKFFEQREIKSKFFAICFSGMESEDMLSQWRGYGDDGKGVAIAFDEDIIKKTRKKIVFKQEKNKPRLFTTLS